MTTQERKFFRRGAFAGWIITILNCGIAFRLEWVTPIEVLEAITGYIMLYHISWIFLQRPDQIVYITWSSKVLEGELNA